MDLQKDIVLEDGDARFFFRYLEWDTRFFNRDSFILDAGMSRLKPSEKIRDLIAGRLQNSFVTVKIDSGIERDMLDFFQIADFKYIDTEIVLRFNNILRDRMVCQEGIELIEVRENENLPYEKLGSVYSLTRFHSDVHIPRQKADLLWINYIMNYKPSAYCHMFVAKYGGDVAGALLANETEDRKTVNLFFVSVIEHYRGKKIGSSLLDYVVRHFRGREILTGTQVKNIRALNFYISNGFTIIDATKTVMHRWS